MSYGITVNGFVRKPLSVIKTEIKAQLEADFNYEIGPESSDTKVIDVAAAKIDEQWAIAESIYYRLRPSQATGRSLDNLAANNFVNRQDPTPSKTTVELSSVSGTIVPAGTTFNNENTANNPSEVFEWTLDENTTVEPNITKSAKATCTVFGPTPAPDGTITKIVDFTSGLDSVTNTGTVLGNNIESDEVLRARRKASVSRAGSSQMSSITAEILSVESVVNALVIQTPFSTGTDGQPRFTIRAIVEGGDDQAIAEAIFKKIPQGIPTWASPSGTTVTITDKQGLEQDIKFDRPTEIPIYVKIVGTALDPDNFDVAELKSAVAQWGELNLSSGDDVYAGQLYTPVGEYATMNITDIFVGTSPNPTGSEVLISNSQASIWEVANISFN